ncbi:MAG: asparagine synthase (glutamine-hydrolyzing) [Sedimentisphaerales bacterium]|nr:asparagine synthase (glutamine-hydrolyzing) [Sedimentisphaerales bacterium]
MCGIVGIHNLGAEEVPIDLRDLRRMMTTIRHRGPDEAGVYLDDAVGLGHLRLSIIDLESGAQPIHNEDKTLWIVYNGEVFNYIELRETLEAKGHRFYTTSDTEVIVHLYEEHGPECLNWLNGQFAFALWDSMRRSLLLARDRLGIRPLHYAVSDNRLIFGSEIKAILTYPGMPRRLDPVALDQIFTFWTTLSARTAFEGIQEMPPGCYLLCRQGRPVVRRYWDVPLVSRQDQATDNLDRLSEQVYETLLDAVRLRLRADVPVGSYLSGGLDSSIVTSLIVKNFNNAVRTFGITFEEAGFDEQDYQNEMVRFLRCNHSEIQTTNESIGAQFQQALWHCEKPVLRTAPIPMLRLSRLVRDSGFKVVLSGEGADEVFGGYNIFREAKIRRFWARSPQSQRRANLIGHLYPYIFNDPRLRRTQRDFFAKGLDRVESPTYSHHLRWGNAGRLKGFFSDELKRRIGRYDPCAEVIGSLPDSFRRVDHFAQAQYLEMTIFLSNYLLSSQGDRMAMANSVETRLPYLDYRIVEFMARVPARWKILGLDEKHILKRTFKGQLPERIRTRPKHPYRAPIRQGLLAGAAGAHTRDMLAPTSIDRAGLFDSKRVALLLQKGERSSHFSELDSMALVGILSTQSIVEHFVDRFPTACEDVRPCLLIDRRNAATQHLREAELHDRV